MKKLFVIILVLAFHSIFAQSSTVQEAMKFYPLNNGDYWEYGRFMNDNYVVHPVEPYYWLQVMGDTVFSNGKSYKKIKRGFFSDNNKYLRYERLDSTTLSVYRIYDGVEYKIDSLLANPGDSIICSRFHTPNVLLSKCLSEGEETFFNQKFTAKTMQDFSSSMAYKYKLVKGLGYCYSESMELTFQGDKLLYAIINGVEFGIKTEIVNHDEIPTQFILSRNYPNPFNPSTTIKFSIPSVGAEHVQPLHVVLKVFDLLGRVVATLVNEDKSPGNYEMKFDGTKMPSGVYYYIFDLNGFSQSKKMVLIK